ncbi:MAG: hypothetical protein EOL88_04610 [Bacteroidia bacterium]|nr:hypothetical protein [Bacteroidia bacterium]
MKYSLPLIVVFVLLIQLFPGFVGQKVFAQDFILHSHSFEFIDFSLQTRQPDRVMVYPESIAFERLSLEGYTTTMIPGAPALPVFSRLFEIPVEAVPGITVTFRDSALIHLKAPVFPFQPSLSKSDDPEEVPFAYNPVFYTREGFLQPEVVKFEISGIQRDTRIMRLAVCPFRYLPENQLLVVYSNLQVQVTFEKGNLEKTRQLKQKFFAGTPNTFLQMPLDQIPSQNPVTYVIVTDRMFEAQLQPFIAWKEQKGFRIVVGYTDETGFANTSIKAWLSGLYNNPAPGYSPPLFLLLVGDVAQIPAWSGITGSHKTDFYYTEFTGDMLPDLYCGRFSANSPEQLQPQIDKTLDYEQYNFPNPAFLDEVVLVSGADISHSQTYGNGQIGYGINYYFNAANGLLSHTYLQPEPSGANYSANIRQNVSDGVAYANYTAHCGVTGWSNPSFLSSHVDALQNAGQYALMVGNCCQSATFASNCFGETLLRAPEKGAIGYIGGTNYTYWDEDFWWGVGVEPISANPLYHVENLGAYDRRFHTMPDIARTEWYVTQGEMTTAGNLAVLQSGSAKTLYYWEIYTLLGDPSLSVWFAQPSPLPVTYSAVTAGVDQLQITTESDALVALQQNGIHRGSAYMGADGQHIFPLAALAAGDTLMITATHPAFQPCVDTLVVENDLLQQTVYLLEGWNGISAFLALSDSVTSSLLGPLGDTLTILKDLEHVFWPPYANTIPYWQSNAGYLIKVKENCQVRFSGEAAGPQTIVLTEGWNLIAVPSAVPVNVEQLFAAVVDRLIICKSINGSGVYWPDVNVNSLGSLLPGKAYMIKVSETCTICFNE